jgi:hypothetical protein
MRSSPFDRAVAAVRTGTAALAVAVALFLLLRIPLLATFRVSLVVLAALELLSFGRRALSRDARAALWAEVALKLAVLAVAYLAVGG